MDQREQTPRRRTPTLQGVDWAAEQRDRLRAARREPTLADLAAALEAPRVRTATHERPVARTTPPPAPATATALAPVTAELGQLTERVERLGEVAAVQIEQAHAFEEGFSGMTAVFEQQKRSLDEYTRALLSQLGSINTVPTDVKRLERAITQTWAKQSEKMDQVIGALEANTLARKNWNRLVGHIVHTVSTPAGLVVIFAFLALQFFGIVRGLIQ